MSADTIAPAAGAIGRAAGVDPLPHEPSSGRVALGQCWRGQYRVTAHFGEPTDGWYHATELGSGQEVVLRVWASNADAGDRTAKFEKMRTIACPGWQRPMESIRSDGEGVEIWEAPPGASLRSWRAGRSAPDSELTTRLVRHLTEAVEALHAVGWGHFNLSPDRIFVRETPEGPQFVVGGLDRVADVAGDGLIPIDADPLSAPPETAGLYKHPSGPSLFAWDWWSLGRVVQEFVLGRHAVTLLPDSLKAGLPRGLVGLAEALLFERATGTIRAGAVEIMGPLEPRVERLLRGLLTSSRDGRWGGENVRAWLAGELPVDRYHSARNEQFFQIDGRSHSVAEAADRLLGPEYVASMEDHALAAGKPGTLAKFLADAETHRRDREQLEAVAALEKSTALSKVDPSLRRRIVATMGLHSLAQGMFRWRGLALTVENIRTALTDPAGFAAWRTELIALSEPVLVAQIRRHDRTAAGLLDEFVKRAVEAEEFFAKQVGLTVAALGAPAKLWLLALNGEAALTAARLEMKVRYAMTTNAAAEKLFDAPHPTPVMTLVFARMGEEASRFGFLTHEEARRRKLEALLTRGAILVEIVFWGRLGLAMKVGPMVFGRRWLFAAAGIGGVLLLAVHVPGPKGLVLGVLPLAGAMALRLLANREQAGSVARWIPKAAPWRWRDGVGRCDTEAQTLARTTGQPAALKDARRELTRICDEVKTLTVPSEPVHLTMPPRQAFTWAMVAAGWVLGGLLVAGSMREGLRRPPTWAMHISAWEKIVHPPHELTPEEARRNALLKWPYRPSLLEPPYELTIQGEFHPTPEQVRYVLARARQQLAAYNPETIDALVAIYVPVDDRHGALMLFDGRKDALQGNNGVLINYVPFAKQWLGIGDKRALFIEK